MGLVAAASLGPALLPTLLPQPSRAMALTLDQIVEKLKPIPVFTLANDQGEPLIATPPATATDKKPAPIAGAFIDEKDAEAFLASLKTNNPALAKTVHIVPLSLGSVYALTQKNPDTPGYLAFSYVPNQQQVQAALALLKQQGQNLTQFNGVPLFVARGGAQKTYLTIKIDGKEVIPLFFDEQQLEALLAKFKKEQPAIASTLEVQVLNLEGMLELMRKNNGPQFDQLVLVPSQDSLDYINSLQKSPTPQPSTAPKPSSAP